MLHGLWEYSSPPPLNTSLESVLLRRALRLAVWRQDMTPPKGTVRARRLPE